MSLLALAARRCAPRAPALAASTPARPVRFARTAAAPREKRRWGPPLAPDSTQLPKGCLVGEVVSTAMGKTVNVDVTRTRVVPKSARRADDSGPTVRLPSPRRRRGRARASW